ncbi:MAG: DUF2911 domain-containing protein [Chitinophagaceae bacterium]|nr:DUF2911 domain-containing protein [Chitinophagaceae bacterium]
MIKLVSLVAFAALSITCFTASAQDQDKSKRPSPLVAVSQTITGSKTVKIEYGQPSVKGRTIGKDLEPKAGEVWRAGANEATTFEVSKDVTVEGKALPAGKYAVFMIDNGDEWTIIFNKTWKTWGAYDYEKNKAEDALQVKVKAGTSTPPSEKLTYTIAKDGTVALGWGEKQVKFVVK